MCTNYLQSLFVLLKRKLVFLTHEVTARWKLYILSTHIKHRSRIHERKILLRFLDIILRVLRLEVSVYNVHITNKFQTTFAGGGGVKFVSGVADPDPVSGIRCLLTPRSGIRDG